MPAVIQANCGHSVMHTGSPMSRAQAQSNIISARRRVHPCATAARYSAATATLSAPDSHPVRHYRELQLSSSARPVLCTSLHTHVVLLPDVGVCGRVPPVYSAQTGQSAHKKIMS